jgi:hypothetical protein
VIDERHPPHSLVRDCIFAHEVLRRIGFPANEIYAGVANIVGVGRAAVMVLRSAGRQWTWTIGRLEMPDLEFQRLYEEAGEAWNRLDPAGDVWGFHGSDIDARGAVVIASIVSKGIPIPRHP